MKDITRRELFGFVGKSAVATSVAALSAVNGATKPQRVAGPLNSAPPPDLLPKTQPLTKDGDLAAQMVEGIHRSLIKQTEKSVDSRQALWHPDYSSPKAYDISVDPNRRRLCKAIGVIDQRVPFEKPAVSSFVDSPPVVATGKGYKIYGVQWPVLDGVDSEGLLLEPVGIPVARVIALPDADWSPEMVAGLAAGLPPDAQYARRLAENGCTVLVPTLIDRKDAWSGNQELGIATNLTHREYIYRMAYEIGRHPIGYEVQKILAAVDWFSKLSPSLPIGVIGYGEGGLLALYSAAIDPRIDAAAVSGYFQSRQNVWQEPIYRNVWTLLHEFGDAELATLIAPRRLVVEASRGPQISGPPPASGKRPNSAAPGRIVSPSLPEVLAETERARPTFARLDVADRLTVVDSDGGNGKPGSEQALRTFLRGLGLRGNLKTSGPAPRDERKGFDPFTRLRRQFDQLVRFTQRAVIQSESVRHKFWANADDSSLERWQASTAFYRRYLWEEIIGKLPEPSEPLQAQTRKIYEEIGWTGYEVLLPLWPEVYAYGILLLPRAIEAGERRPVVVCQHGLEDRPRDLIKPDRVSEHTYHRFAVDLVDHGFVVYCPQNPYIGDDGFRKLQRLANPLKLSLFSFILSQHQRTLDWLSEQPFVDPKRIAFYGLSYGGKTAVRVPPLLDRYALSICSGDFNEWIWKTSRDDAPFTYVFAGEYEVLEFGLGNAFNHSEMANLMAPRPFMVERGHNDGVSVDSWVAYEFAKVRRHYDRLGLSGRARIEYFDGPHTIHGVGTFQFLHEFLNWGEPFRW
jgi:dienelactone hydrolase